MVSGVHLFIVGAFAAGVSLVGCASILGADFDHAAAISSDGDDAAIGSGDAASSANDARTKPGATDGSGGDDDDDAPDGTSGDGDDASPGDDDAAASDGGTFSEALACGATSGLQTGSPWPMEGACPGRANRSPARAQMNPRILARYDLRAGSLIVGPPVIALDGTVYIPVQLALADGGVGYELAAIKNGALAFAAPFANSIGTPTIGKDASIYVHGASSLTALSPNGMVDWTVPLDTSGTDSPVVLSDGTVVVLDGSAMVFVEHGDSNLVSKYTLPSGQAFVGSATVSASAVVYAVAAVTSTSSRLLYGIDSTQQSTLTNPIQLQSTENTFPQMDNRGYILVAGDGVFESYAPGGQMITERTFTGTLVQTRMGFDGTGFWAVTASGGPTHLIEDTGVLTMYGDREPGAVSPIAVVGDGSIVFSRRSTALTPVVGVEGWTSKGASRWTVALDDTTSNPTGVAIGADGSIYVSSANTLYKLSD